MHNTAIPDHPMIGQTRIYRPDQPPYDPALDTEGGTLVLGAGFTVEIKAVFADWNDMPGLDMLYVFVHETGYYTHVSPTEIGMAGATSVLSGWSKNHGPQDTFDNETNDYALSDCGWWDTPAYRRPWWATGDCSGRVGDTEYGVVCEHHHNAMPHIKGGVQA